MEEHQYLDDYEVWKSLIIAIIIRALMDIEQRSPSVAGSVDRKTYMDNMQKQAKRFINGKYCAFMSEVIGLDIEIVRRYQALPSDRKQIQRTKVINSPTKRR